MSKSIELKSFEMNVLRFLWVWKASTTAAIHACVEPSRSVERIYRRLLAMEKFKFISSHVIDSTEARIWLLDQRGFQIFQKRLPRLVESGYKSEHLQHDIVCQAIHLGDWLGQPPTGCDVFSEQQLRRIATAFYPAWVPNTPSHRPDGWWKVQSGDSHKLVALEVELSPKDIGSYENVGEFYSELISPDRIVWLVRGKEEGAYIHRHLLAATRGRSYSHSFIYLCDFIQHGWQSPIRIGKNVGEKLDVLFATQATPKSPEGVGQVFFDFRKKPMKPNGSRLINPSEIL